MEPINCPEWKEQCAIIEWIKLQHPHIINYTIYIMNEAKKSVHAGAIANKMGRLKGASDLFLAVPTIKHYGLFIEVKSKKGKPTKFQLEFNERMNKIGYLAKICYGADEAISVINDYLKVKI